MQQLRYQLFVIRSVILAYQNYFLWLAKINLFNIRKQIEVSRTHNQLNSLSSFNPSSFLGKVVHINTDDQSGGAARVARDLCEQQIKMKTQSIMLVGTKKMDISYSHPLQPSTSKKQHFLRFAQDKLDWQDFFHLSSFNLIKNKFIKAADIIHLHNLHTNYFSYLALPNLGSEKHIIWSIHDMHPFTGHCAYSLDCNKWQHGCGNCPDLKIFPSLKKDTTKFILKSKSRSYSNTNIHIVALSEWMRRQLNASVLKNQPIHLIYNGIDTTIFYPKNKQEIRAELGLPKDKIIILFSANLGSVNPFKGGEFLEKLVSDYRDNANILFIAIGNDKRYTPLDSNIWSIPYVSIPQEMASYYSAADVYLYPSIADNCPLVVLEAMGCGTPVLAFDTGGTSELVEHKKTGYIANYKSYTSLKLGFDWLLENNELRIILGQNGVSRINDMFTIQHMTANYNKLYAKILSKA